MKRPLTAKQNLVRAQREPTRCAVPSCSADLAGLHYFCRSCFMKAPAKLRTHLYAMHARGQDCRSKVAQIVRALEAEEAAPPSPAPFVDQGEPGPGVP
jgi:hypothetical protein